MKKEIEEKITFEKACAEAMLNKEFVANYDRLCNSSLGKVLSATGINAAIDESSGFKKAEIIKFAAFFDEFVWGRLPQDCFVK